MVEKDVCFEVEWEWLRGVVVCRKDWVAEDVLVVESVREIETCLLCVGNEICRKGCLALAVENDRVELRMTAD